MAEPRHIEIDHEDDDAFVIEPKVFVFHHPSGVQEFRTGGEVPGWLFFRLAHAAAAGTQMEQVAASYELLQAVFPDDEWRRLEDFFRTARPTIGPKAISRFAITVSSELGAADDEDDGLPLEQPKVSGISSGSSDAGLPVTS